MKFAKKGEIQIQIDIHQKHVSQVRSNHQKHLEFCLRSS